jgi:arylsulfatase A-like enzyme
LTWPVGLLVCVVSLAASVRAAEPPAGSVPPAVGKPKPNIIFILADDLGYGDLGCFGQQRIRTPNLDRMAADGVRFTQFYAGCTVCAPSRCVLMTGLHTGHARVRGNADVPLTPDDVTVAKVLRDSGYRNALIGKWGLGEIGSTGAPTRQGFDYFFGFVNQVHAHNYYPQFLWRNEEKVPLRNEVPPGKHPAAEKVGGGVATKKVDYAPDLFTAEALRWVEQNKAGPFFLYLAYTTPHANDEAAPRGMEVPDQAEYARENWPAVERDKAAMITRLDRDIGTLFDLLKRLSIDENTIVFFTSDNGPHKEGGVDPAFFKSSGPLRGIKRDLYEGGVREPTIVRWPGHTRPGTTSDFPGTFQDFLATAADLAGAPAPPKTDGVSLLPSILGHPDQQKQHDYLYWEFYEGGGSQAVRSGDWKAVRKPLEGKTELYDLKTDLAEQHDVAAEHPDLVRNAESIMRQAHTPSEQWKLPSEGGTTRPAARARARPQAAPPAARANRAE